MGWQSISKLQPISQKLYYIKTGDKMADGHVSRSSHIIALFFLGIILSARRLSFEDGFRCNTTLTLKFGLYVQPGKALTAYLILDQVWDNSRHDSKVYRAKGHLRARMSRYPNSASTFQISRLIISGDIAENPGPTLKKQTCPKCSRTIAKNHRSLTCSACT